MIISDSSLHNIFTIIVRGVTPPPGHLELNVTDPHARNVAFTRKLPPTVAAKHLASYQAILMYFLKASDAHRPAALI